jgi:hypothetical protein
MQGEAKHKPKVTKHKPKVKCFTRIRACTRWSQALVWLAFVDEKLHSGIRPPFNYIFEILIFLMSIQSKAKHGVIICYFEEILNFLKMRANLSLQYSNESKSLLFLFLFFPLLLECYWMLFSKMILNSLKMKKKD